MKYIFIAIGYILRIAYVLLMVVVFVLVNTISLLWDFSFSKIPFGGEHEDNCFVCIRGFFGEDQLYRTAWDFIIFKNSYKK